MKRFLVTSALIALTSGSAFAADVLYPDAPPPAEEFSWTGVYVGVSGGVSDGVSSADVSYANVDADAGAGPNGSFSNGM